ncbi:MAG: putative lipid II flippase FtsW [Defluviitaleaceae bacterium]|nr:putative lipid II flippase FtsW [Defluviitaleaceae bacterium]
MSGTASVGAEKRRNRKKAISGKTDQTGTIRTIIRVGSMDYTIYLVAVILAAIGVVMVFSASYLSAGASKALSYDSFYYLKKQAIFAVMGVCAMHLMANVGYRYLQKLALIIYIIANALLVLVQIIGLASHGAVRWIPVPVIGQFQPSEVAKLAVILMVAFLISRNKDILKKWPTFIFVCAVVGVTVALIGIGNLSTAIIVGVVGIGIIFISSTHLLRFVVGGLAAVGGLVGYLVKGMLDPSGGNWRGGRFAAWLDPFGNMSGNGKGYQIVQSLYAIASGGLFGLGIGMSRQKTFLPEAHNDIIFSIICEELGFVGAAMVLLLFGILIWRGIRVALNAPDTFGSLVASGIVILIAVQVLINVAVVTNTIPNTGIPLPLISYGGTSLVVTMALVGILLNISRYSKERM